MLRKARRLVRSSRSWFWRGSFDLGCGPDAGIRSRRWRRWRPRRWRVWRRSHGRIRRWRLRRWAASAATWAALADSAAGAEASGGFRGGFNGGSGFGRLAVWIRRVWLGIAVVWLWVRLSLLRPGYGYGLGGYGYGGSATAWGYGLGGYGLGYRLATVGRLRLWVSLGYGYGYGYPYYGYGVGRDILASDPGTGCRDAGFSYSPAYVAPAAWDRQALANGRRILGIDEEPVVLPDGRKGMKITNVYPGTGAANGRSSGRRRADLGERLPDRAARQSGLDHRQRDARQRAEDGRPHGERRQGPHGHWHDESDR